MTRNEGNVDRALRVIVGLVLIALALTGKFAPCGVVPLVTGLLGTCPIYSIFGINTCGVK